MTVYSVRVLQVLLRQRSYYYEIHALTGIAQGTLSPILKKFEEAGWISGEEEEFPPGRKKDRPLRRYFSLTQAGRENATREIRKIAGQLNLDKKGTPE